MRKLIAIATLASSAALYAAEPRQCPNPDVMNALVFMATADMKAQITPHAPRRPQRGFARLPGSA